jgi:hypothetical protein
VCAQIAEPDGARVIANRVCEFIERVPDVVENVCHVSSRLRAISTCHVDIQDWIDGTVSDSVRCSRSLCARQVRCAVMPCDDVCVVQKQTN